jgi:cell division protein FtsN
MPSAHTDSASPGAASTTRYGVQFAAYNDRPGADKFAAILRGRGITARVEGDAAPFRVRAGRFPTRAEAEASAALWRRPGQPAIVVTLAPTP